MYTCCPECETTFRLNAEDLRRAHGQVRCGECDHVFNAIEFLSEENTEVEVAEAEAVMVDASDDSVFALDTEPANDALAENKEDNDEEPDYEPDKEPDIDDTGAGLLVTDPDDDESDATKAWNEPADGEYEEEDAAAEDEADAEYALYDYGDGLTSDEEAESEELALVGKDEDEDEDEEEEDDEVEREYNRDSGEVEETGFEIGGYEETPEEDDPEEDEMAEPEADESMELSADEDDDEDFDDTVWERIPGVGSATYYTEDEDDEPESEQEADNSFENEDEAVSALGDDDEPGDEADEDDAEPADPDEPSGEQDWEETTTGSWSSEVLTPGGVTAGEVFSGEATEEIVLETVELNKVLEDYETTPPWQPESVEVQPEQNKPSRTALWFLTGVLLFFGFSTQLAHYNRDKLAAHSSFGGTVRSVYKSLGSGLYPDWSVSNYEIRGSEAVAGESGTDVLDIRTQIAAISDDVTGLPQLRVVLRDRWSNPVAARHFSPEEYMDGGELPADRLLRPNETISAHVSIVDPGADAQGFELELCLPRRHTGLDCK